MNDLQILKEYLLFLIPLIILQLILAITALLHVLKNPNYRFGTKPMWIAIVLLFQIVGPVIYFSFGRGDS